VGVAYVLLLTVQRLECATLAEGLAQTEVSVNVCNLPRTHEFVENPGSWVARCCPGGSFSLCADLGSPTTTSPTPAGSQGSCRRLQDTGSQQVAPNRQARTSGSRELEDGSEGTLPEMDNKNR
jgi:hypothetical protein